LDVTANDKLIYKYLIKDESTHLILSTSKDLTSLTKPATYRMVDGKMVSETIEPPQKFVGKNSIIPFEDQ